MFAGHLSGGRTAGFRSCALSSSARFTVLAAIVIAFPFGVRGATPNFADDVAPILAARCIGCHMGNVLSGGLNLDAYEGLMKGGGRGASVIAGKPEESRLLGMVTGAVQPVMPMAGPRLSAGEVETIRRWIAAGAPAPAAGEVPSVYALLKNRAESARAERVQPKAALQPQIYSMAFSPGGQIIAVGGYRQVRLIDAVTGENLATLKGSIQVVRGVAFSNDGKWVAGASGLPARSGELKIWNVAERKLLRTVEGHSDTMYAAAFAPDGATIATSSYDKLIKIWDVETGAEIRTLKDHIDAVYALAFTADGSRLVSGSADRGVKIWNPATGERIYTLSDPLDGINSVALDPDGRRVAAGGVDRTLRVWRLGDKQGELLDSLIAHQAPILQVAFSPDGKTLASASADGTIKIFEADGLEEVKTIGGQPDWVMALEFSPDGSLLAAGRFDGSLSLYETSTFNDRLGTLRASRE